jgi:hypothetical protein
MKRKLSLICAVAVGMAGWSSFASFAAPATAVAAAPAPAATDPLAGGLTAPAPVIADSQPTATLAAPPAPAVVMENVPTRDVKLSFASIAPAPGSMVLRGAHPDGSVEFGMRSDEVVTKALLNLDYTPSPSLLPVQSQLKVYLNDELMGVLPVTKEQLGKKSARRSLSILCISPTLTACVWCSSAIIAMCVRTRPAVRYGWTSGVTVTWT